MDLGLGDWVVLITGGGGGAGPTLARAFAAERAAVALHHRGARSTSAARAEATAADIVAGGGRAIAVAADLGSSIEVSAMVKRIAAELGYVEVLMTANSAYKSERFVDIGDDSWSEVVDDLLGATFRTCRAVIPRM